MILGEKNYRGQNYRNRSGSTDNQRDNYMDDYRQDNNFGRGRSGMKDPTYEILEEMTEVVVD